MGRPNAPPNTLTSNLYFLCKIAKISPSCVIHTFIKSFLDRATWAFYTVVFMRFLFGADEISRPYGHVAAFLLLTALVMCAAMAYDVWYENIFFRREEQRLAFALNRELFEKASAVDVGCYEDPEFYDSYTKAQTEVFTRAKSVLTNCANLLSCFLAAAFVISTVVSLNLFAGVFTFLSFIGSFVFGRIQRKLNYDRDMENVPHERRMAYVNRVAYLAQYAKEIRLTKIFGVMRNSYGEAYDGIFKNVQKYWKKMTVIGTLESWLVFPIVFEGMWLYAAYLAIVKQTILIGDFIVMANAIVNISWMLFGVRDGIVEGFRNAKYIENLRTFLSHKPTIDENQPGLLVGEALTLELRGVSFKYFNEKEYALKNVSMKFSAGEKISLVGHNGAGKTTLVKLIMRLYDPTEGAILLNGADIREYSLPDYRAAIGAAFQDFKIFSMSAAENVIMGRIKSPEERGRALDAMRQSGAFDAVAGLPEGIDTVLTREFDEAGAVLSGGEYQRIATARAFAKEARILILDEPSSSLDPVAEHRVYETIMRLCESKGGARKIAIIISHRLSSAAGADRVYMLEHGELIESGPHKELLARGGAYSRMYMKQAENYLTWDAANG